MEELYDTIHGFTLGLITKYKAPPLLVADILAAISLQIYKSILSEQDFNNMLDNLSSNRDNIETFVKHTIH